MSNRAFGRSIDLQDLRLGGLVARPSDQLFLVATALVIAVGVGLKFVGLDHQSLWHDELATFVFTERHIPAPELYHQFWDDDGHPPFYYALTHYWIKMFPTTTEVTLRSLSAVLAASAPLVAFFLFRKVLTPSGRLLLAVFISCSFALLYFGQEARSYALLFFESLVMLAVTLMIWRRSESEHIAHWQLLAAALIAVALSYTHLWGLFFAFGCWLTILSNAFYRGRDRQKVLIYGFVTGAIVVVWPLTVFLNLEAMNYSIDWMQRFQDPIVLIVDTSHLLFGNVYALGLMVLIAVVALAKRRFLIRDVVPAIAWIALIPGCVAVLAGIGVSALFEPVVSPRNLIVMFPGLFVAMAATMDYSLPRSVTIRLAPIIGAIWLIPSLDDYYDVHKTQWRESAQYIKGHPGCAGAAIPVLQGAEVATKGWSDRLPHRRYLETDLIPNVYLGSELNAGAIGQGLERASLWEGAGGDVSDILEAVVGDSRTSGDCEVLLWLVGFPDARLKELDWPSGVRVTEFFEAAVLVRD
jgi:hypothetical protein